MGITNFCKFIDCVSPPSDKPVTFDSILVDAQSYLYVAIELCLQSNEDDFFSELYSIVWHQLNKLLTTLFSFREAFDKKNVTIIISLDGEGVPMKWPTQRKRRTGLKQLDRKTIYAYSLFGNNIISHNVKLYLADRFQRYNTFGSNSVKIVISGANVSGEGEHKVFQLAEVLGCRRPVVVSVDQDVFVLALWRLEKYETIQIYRYNHFYNVSEMVEKALPYSVTNLRICSFLFGNDFIPPVVTISPVNGSKIHLALSRFEDSSSDSQSSTCDDQECPLENEACVMARFLKNLKGDLRYQTSPHVERRLIVSFWITYLWVADYYRLRHFPQKYIINTVFDEFDRNQIFTALLHSQNSSEALREAKRFYKTITTESLSRDKLIEAVFTDPILLERVKAYWSIQDESGSGETCKVFRLTKRSQS